MMACSSAMVVASVTNSRRQIIGLIRSSRMRSW
jgi:hypothetical protein